MTFSFCRRNHVAFRTGSLLIALAASTLTCAAQTSGLAIVAAKVDPLPVYAAPGDVNPSGKVAVTGLPWPVSESRADFFRVKVEGNDVWVDAMTVRSSQKVAARCASIQGAPVAGELGASSERCR